LPPDPAVAEANQKKRAGLVRMRAVALLLAVVVPALLFTLFERQARRLDALADHGVRVDAVVVGVGAYTEYAYEIEGKSYRWSVRRDAAPFPLGATLPVRVLPDNPAVSRPGEDGAIASRDAAETRGIAPRAMPLVLLFFFLLAGVAHRDLRRLQGATPAAPLDPRRLGRGLGVVVVAMLLGVNAYDDVHAVQVAAFGARPLGLPVALVCTVVEALLFAPFVLVIEHLMFIMASARRDGAGVGGIGLGLYMAQLGEHRPELKRPRAIVVAGLVYFVALMGAWIAFTSARGI